MAAAAAPRDSGPGMDARLDQETARWLRWDQVRATAGWERAGDARGTRGVRAGGLDQSHVLPGPAGM
jgi:hypothetical protein